MRPLEGSRLWRPFGKFLWGRKQPVPALPAWLSARSLHFIVNFVAIQVFSFRRILTICRRCDSRNMNLSPFCTLNANSMLPKWQDAVNQTYGSSRNGLEYISGLPSPIRKEYKKQIMQEREILSSLSEVNLLFSWIHLFDGIFRTTLCTMLTKGILLWSTSFLASRRHLVNLSDESF